MCQMIHSGIAFGRKAQENPPTCEGGDSLGVTLHEWKELVLLSFPQHQSLYHIVRAVVYTFH